MESIQVISYQFKIRLIGTSCWKENKSLETVLSSRQLKRGWIAFCLKLICSFTVALKASKNGSSFFCGSKSNCQRFWCALWRRTCSGLWGNSQTNFIMHSSCTKQVSRVIFRQTPHPIKAQQPCWSILKEGVIIPRWMFPLARTSLWIGSFLLFRFVFCNKRVCV